jgi:hypothetical protein
MGFSWGQGMSLIRSAGRTFKAWAIFLRLRSEIFCSPRSASPTKFRWTPAISANFSWETPRAVRNSFNLLPKIFWGSKVPTSSMMGRSFANWDRFLSKGKDSYFVKTGAAPFATESRSSNQRCAKPPSVWPAPPMLASTITISAKNFAKSKASPSVARPSAVSYVRPASALLGSAALPLIASAVCDPPARANWCSWMARPTIG